MSRDAFEEGLARAETRSEFLKELIKIQESEHLEPVPDSKAAIETGYLDEQIGALQVESLKQDIKERKKYAGRIFKLICFWLLGIAFILVAQGFGRHIGFDLDRTVLAVLTGKHRMPGCFS